MTSKFLKDLHRRTLQNYLDIIILTKLQERSLSGYDLVGYINKKYGILISPGTIYSILYSLERRGYIEGQMVKRKRLYKLTKKENQNTIKKTNNEVQKFLRQITLLETNNTAI
ncbi:PadR family transcriptional regulator [Candidatus Bathyarchaeota archaeon]|nr:PadR family transcriptional regulator [Candidatus Bathyarchaeota archaeon]